MFDPERTGEHDVTPPLSDLLTDNAATRFESEPPTDAPAPPRPRPPVRRTAPRWMRRRGPAATVAIVAVALVAGLLAWNAGRQPDGLAIASHPDASDTAAGSGGPATSPVPGSSDAVGPAASFEPLTGVSVTPAALLTARGAHGAVVSLDASFRLESTDATPASTLAAGLTVEPSFSFSVTKEAGDHAALLAPASRLIAGVVYQFTLHGAAGQLLDTWAFQARQPLRIVGTLPETQSAEVPIDTGIEVTFDQDGVADAASHFSIQPAVKGRFEQHGRTLAFIPDRPLAATTLYAVTVTRGIKVDATGEATIVDTRFQFETAAKVGVEDPLSFEFPDDVVEASTSERAAISVWTYGGKGTTPTTTDIAVYRLPGLNAAIDAFRTIRARPDWTRWTNAGLVDVSGFPRVVSASLPLRPYRGGFFVQLPAVLPAGWYVVQQADGTKPIQAILQVTDVAGYLAVSDTKTLVWANDLRTRGPIVGATVASDGVRFGRTDARGLAVGATPKSLRPVDGTTCDHPCDPVVVVRTTDGRQVFLPTNTSAGKFEGYGDLYWWSEADARTWSLLHTDRSRYRSGDTVNLWGYARDRDSGAAPATVTVRLDAFDSDTGATGAAPVASLKLHPGAAGAFSASIPLAGLPDGDYTIVMSLGSREIRSTSIVVGPIAKPAYQLEVTTGRRVYIAGDRVKVTVGAHFFEGTPVPGVPLDLDLFADGTATTDSLGTAIWRTTAIVEEPKQEGPISGSAAAHPARAEEADITASSPDIMVFPSMWTIDGDGQIAHGKVIVRGGLHQVARDRLEAAIHAGSPMWDLDPRGAAIRGATITVTFIELVPSRRQVGTEYDFVEKKVVPIYEIELHDRVVGTVHVKTTTDGSWTASVPASVSNHSYRIEASAKDPDRHVARVTAYASRTLYADDANPQAQLAPTSATANPDGRFGIGEKIDVRLIDPNHAQTAGDGTRYLFFTAQRGIHAATVQSSRRYLVAFPSWGPPNLSVGGVRFTGEGYVGAVWYEASFRASDRRLQVDLTTDAARYAPGGTATVRVRTRSASGAPVSATVILRAVDEKLFVIGAADEEDPLSELYGAVGNGIFGTYGSHRDPRGESDGGDTGGGGGDGRDDFRDSLLFTSITTGPDGRGSTSFRLSDDLTSWRVTAAAVTRNLQAGVGSVLVPVGLPFFVDASIAPEYLAADRPTIAIRTFGSAIVASSKVTVRVTSKTLDFDSGPLSASAFANLDVPLPALRAGIQTITITATTGTGSTARTDRLTRTFNVVATRLTRQRTSYVELPSTAPFAGGDGFTTVLVADASGGRYLPLLTDLAAGGGARLDRALAADLAARLLKDRFGSEGTDTAEPFEAQRYQGLDDGLAIVPYASSDLELSALVAIVAPDRVDRAKLSYYLRTIRDNAEETRERRMFALAGLGGLGESVLPAIQTAAADTALTVREQLMLGLGAVSLGDSATGRTILTNLVNSVGEGSGMLARLRVGTTAADITAGTALAAALAAAVGDPLAPRFWAYVEANPAVDRIEVLPAIAFVTHTLDRLPVQAARFAWTVEGTRHVVDLGAGESLRLYLSPAQLASLSIERLAGSVGVTTEWREDVAPAAFTPDPDLTITRSVSPSGSIHAADLVVVELHVTFTPQAATGCRQVTELVPSGLAPVGAGSRWFDPDAEEPRPDDGVVLPYDQVGSRVFFCVEPGTTRHEFTLRYVARVVTPGTYAWEPAVAQSRTDENVANLTPPTSITIQ